MIEFPWTKRANAERQKRVEAERRRDDILSDWEPVRRGIEAVEAEVRLNDFTRKARRIFGGGTA